MSKPDERTRKEKEDDFRKKWLRGSDCEKYPTEVQVNEFGIFTVGDKEEPDKDTKK